MVRSEDRTVTSRIQTQLCRRWSRETNELSRNDIFNLEAHGRTRVIIQKRLN